jgi:3-hydroxyisobutyrate dehydrogenase-like beta-hydroxyacid dehydrogenase
MTTLSPLPLNPLRSVGVVGWGRMGSIVGGHLIAKGWRIVGTDVSHAARARIRDAGAELATDARALAAGVDLVLVLVVDDDQVRDVFLGASGLLAGARPGTVIAICASVGPATCVEMAKRAEAQSVHVIDAAMLRGEAGAEQANVLLFCGGDAPVIDACRPIFAAFAPEVLALGAIGSGQVGLSVANIVLWGCLRADYEALLVADRLGLDLAAVRSAIGLSSGANRPLSEWGMHRLRWPKKDLDVAIALAESHDVAVPLLHALAPLMASLTPDDLAALM